MDFEMKLRAIWEDIMEFDATSLCMTDRLIDLGVNSIIFIKLVITIEEEFGIEFENEYLNIDLFKTMSDIVEYIKVRKNM